MAAQVTSLATLRETQTQVASQNIAAGFFNADSFELLQRIAKAFASSTLVPPQYQGNIANTMIALSMAQRMGADPMMTMQNLAVIHGRPSWSSKFLIATFNACGRFSAMRFRFTGTEGQDDWACQAYATEKATGHEIEGAWISIKMAKDEGWHGKNGSKWKTMPQQMLMYRAASFMVNVYAPELSMGLSTVEEAHDIIDVSRHDDGVYSVATVETLRQPVVKDSLTTEQDGEWPKADSNGELFDSRGLPWIESIHSANKTCNDDGTWRRKRGVHPETVKSIEEAAQPSDLVLTQPPEITDYDRIRRGIDESNDNDQIDNWIDMSRDASLSDAQREEIDRLSERRKEEIS